METKWLIFSYERTTVHRDASEFDYSANIRFDDKGKVYFIIDDEVFVNRPFKAESQDKSDGILHFDLKVDVNAKDLDIDDHLTLRHYDSDTLVVREFPGSGYDPNTPGENYFIRVK